MSATNYNLSGLLIDFTVVPDRVRLIEHFPELSAYPEFVNVHNDNEIKIAILISDIESPFRKIRDPHMRLKALFEFLDIGLVTGAMKDFYDDVLNYRQPEVMAAACRYIQMLNNHDYSIWWTLNLSFYDLQKESVIQRKVDENVKSYVAAKVAITKEMDLIGEKLKTYEARIFGDVKLKQAIVNQELQKISFFPEKMAQEFQTFE